MDEIYEILFVGYDIKIKDKKWAVAIEGYLGAGLLGAFAVDNNKDSQLLREIFNKVWKSGKQPQIITSKFVFKVCIYIICILNQVFLNNKLF